MTNTKKLDYRLKMVEPELNEINDSKTKGIQIRSKAKWIEIGVKHKIFIRPEEAASMS